LRQCGPAFFALRLGQRTRGKVSYRVGGSEESKEHERSEGGEASWRETGAPPSTHTKAVLVGGEWGGGGGRRVMGVEEEKTAGGGREAAAKNGGGLFTGGG